MSKRDELIALYAADIKEKFGEDPDMDLLTKVTVGLGPAIYNLDASKVSGTAEKELETVKNNYLIKKLGMTERADMMPAIINLVEKYGTSNRNKYRAVVYYMLCRQFDRASAYQ